jgi:hypothetical protein
MKVVDLRPDSKLLKPNFDGYKLSLQPIPILKIEDINVQKIQPNSSTEYSFLHSFLFQLHNHLVADPWLANTSYYIDSSLTVNKIAYDNQFGKLKPQISVYKFKSSRKEAEEGSYNAELKFISEKYALISDGNGFLQIIDTGDRQRNDEWKKIDALQPLDEQSFIVQDAKFAMDKGEKIIHCLLLHVEHVEEKFYNFVNWISLKEDGGTKKWNCIARRTLKGKGSLYYLSLDVHCHSIVYSSNHEYKYVFDNVNEIVDEEPAPMEIAENPQAAESVNTFQWSQNGEDLTINFNTIPDATNDMYHVKCLQSHIEVRCGEQVLVKSDLFAEIDVDLTTWTLENDFLQLNLIKRNPDLIWPYLIPSGPIETPPNDKPGQPFNSQPVADLNTQMEECDYGDGDGNINDEYFIERLDSVTHKSTHKIFLGPNHPLFARTLRPGFPKAIAIRSDVDCCLWLQQQVSSTDEWKLKHEG